MRSTRSECYEADGPPLLPLVAEAREIKNSKFERNMKKYVLADAGYADHGKSSAKKAFARLVQGKYPESFKLIKDFENDVKAM